MKRFNIESYRLRRLREHARRMRECVEEDQAFRLGMDDLDSAVAAQAERGSFRTKLKYLARINVNDPHADFWLQRRGSETRVGRPMTRYKRVAGKIEEIGITVTRPDVVAPTYLYAYLDALWRSGYWSYHSSGTLQLQHIRISDVGNVEVS
jgi:hypothetical protein